MRDSYTNRKHSPSHKKGGRMRGMVVGEGGRSTGVLLYCNTLHITSLAYSYNAVQ